MGPEWVHVLVARLEMRWQEDDMSDDVNEYGLGASNTQAEASSETHGAGADPLAHGQHAG